ncbi:hypothetical protein [Corynebacterium sp. H113]|uniref:hypothetical protein n=1 Tax=Corynebacterium sp. H113 TaxID=3133419 RepID=UPI0030A9B7A2
MRVEAPNKEYGGRIGRDVFVDGVCENASESQRWYYLEQGYVISDEDEEVAEDTESDQDAGVPEAPDFEVPSRAASTVVWAEFLTSQGIEHPEDASRAQLIDMWEAHNGEVAD